MELEKIFGNLCNKDPRHPMFVELYGEDDCLPVPRPPSCSCDNCFYGRDRLALEIIRLTPPAKGWLEPGYREPMLPGDLYKSCQFSSDGAEWRDGNLVGYIHRGWRDVYGDCWDLCQIKINP